MALEQNMELVRVEHSMVARAGRLAGGVRLRPQGGEGGCAPRVDGFWKSVGDSADARFLETSKRLRSTVKIFSLCVTCGLATFVGTLVTTLPLPADQ